MNWNNIELPERNIYFQDKDTVIYCADCREILPLIPEKSIDLVLTDPPYGIKRDKGFEGFGGFGTPIARRQYEDDWDSDRPDGATFQLILARGGTAIIFGGNFFSDLLPKGGHWIVWDKLNTMPTFGDCELAWTNVPRTSVKLVVREYNGLIGKEAQRWHPTQKPLYVMSWCACKYSAEGAVILDPFLGSGTTAVAAKKLGRKCIGIEISEKYCQIAVERLRQSVMKMEC